MMIIWIDAHLSPAIAVWITSTFGITAIALRDLGLRDAEDPEILRQQRLKMLRWNFYDRVRFWWRFEGVRFLGATDRP